MRTILFLVFCPSHFRFTSLDMLLFVLLIVGGKMGTPFRPANACLSVLCTLSLSHLCFITFALRSILFLLLPPYTRNSDPGPQNKFFSPLPLPHTYSILYPIFVLYLLITFTLLALLFISLPEKKANNSSTRHSKPRSQPCRQARKAGVTRQALFLLPTNDNTTPLKLADFMQSSTQYCTSSRLPTHNCN